MEKQEEKLRNACHEAFLCLKKIGDPNYLDIQSKLEFVVGSYDFDKNPVGLYEIGNLSVQKLKEVKSTYPRKVSKQLIEDLEKNLQKN
jgi:hypothetical protein